MSLFLNGIFFRFFRTTNNMFYIRVHVVILLNAFTPIHYSTVNHFCSHRFTLTFLLCTADVRQALVCVQLIKPIGTSAKPVA